MARARVLQVDVWQDAAEDARHGDGDEVLGCDHVGGERREVVAGLRGVRPEAARAVSGEVDPVARGLELVRRSIPDDDVLRRSERSV